MYTIGKKVVEPKNVFKSNSFDFTEARKFYKVSKLFISFLVHFFVLKFSLIIIKNYSCKLMAYLFKKVVNTSCFSS